MDKNYLSQLQALLPHGPAWTRDKDAVLTKLLSVFASVFSSIHLRSERLVKEANPLDTNELLLDWERICGLPTKCQIKQALKRTVEMRKNDLVGHLISNSSPTKYFYINLAEKLGYVIDFLEITPFKTGISRCGEALNGFGTDKFTCLIKIRNRSKISDFKAGVSRCGERLKEIEKAMDLECVMNNVKHAHMKFIYSYTKEDI